jgi:predicted RNase H-like nuclease (RuvC/YqgF family)
MTKIILHYTMDEQGQSQDEERQPKEIQAIDALKTQVQDHLEKVDAYIQKKVAEIKTLMENQTALNDEITKLNAEKTEADRQYANGNTTSEQKIATLDAEIAALRQTLRENNENIMTEIGKIQTFDAREFNGGKRTKRRSQRRRKSRRR